MKIFNYIKRSLVMARVSFCYGSFVVELLNKYPELKKVSTTECIEMIMHNTQIVLTDHLSFKRLSENPNLKVEVFRGHRGIVLKLMNVKVLVLIENELNVLDEHKLSKYTSSTIGVEFGEINEYKSRLIEPIGFYM